MCLLFLNLEEVGIRLCLDRMGKGLKNGEDVGRGGKVESKIGFWVKGGDCTRSPYRIDMLYL